MKTVRESYPKLSFTEDGCRYCLLNNEQGNEGGLEDVAVHVEET